ncbi:MAG: RHS repeat-associated core domain-containing protein [Mangrovibacterium sp.]
MSKHMIVIVLLFIAMGITNSTPAREAVLTENIPTSGIEYPDSISAFPELSIGTITEQDRILLRQQNEAAKLSEAQAMRSQMSLMATPAPVILDYSRDVGQIPVNTDVSPSGALTLQVPIEAYPGIGGAQPNISLVYNSQQGYGFIGYLGWSISGLSRISAVNKNIHYDGKTEGVKGTYAKLIDTDALVLDGVRLIRLSQGNYISASGNIKATTTVSTAAGNPLGDITVYYPDGSVAVYSSTVISSFKEYPITRLTDKNGNEMTFSYIAFFSSGNNTYAVSKIIYANGKASIEFAYEGDGDILYLPHYRSGYEYIDNECLTSIRCKLGNTVLREYTFYRLWHRETDVLQSIYCTAAGKALNPLKFTYGTGNNSNVIPIPRTIQGWEWYNFSDPSLIVTQRGKIGWNYGSADDAIIHYPYQRPYEEHSGQYFINKYTGNEKILIYSGLASDVQFADPMPSLKTEAGFVDLLFAELDKIPGEEMVKINTVVEGGQQIFYMTVYQSSGTFGLVQKYKRRFDIGSALDYNGTKSVWPHDFFAIDYNGDGLMEILAVSNNKPLVNSPSYAVSRCMIFDLENYSIVSQQHAFDYFKYLPGNERNERLAANQSDKLGVIDYNGDGKSDIFLINSSGLHFYSFSGASLIEDKTTTVINNYDLVDNSFRWGDFNADGNTDMYLMKGPKKGIYLGKGDGDLRLFFTINLPPISDTDTYKENIMIQDLNGDGYSDLIISGYNTSTARTTIKAYIFNAINPKTPFTQYGSTQSIASRGVVIPVNINSDHYYSKITYLKDGVVSLYSLSRNDQLERLLTSATTSTGLVMQSAYNMLMNTELYGSGGNETYSPGYVSPDNYPYAIFQGPLFVVKAMTSYANTEKVDDLGFHYTGAVLHKQGLGFSGFQEIRKDNNLSYDWTTAKTDPLRYGVPTETDSRNAKTMFTFDVSTESNKRVHSRLSRRVETDKLKNTTITTDYTYDSYDYPLTETTSYGGGITRATSTAYQHTNTTGKYALGLPTEIIITDTRNGVSHQQKSTVLYDANFNLTKKTTHINSLFRSEENCTYTSKGLIESKSVKEYTSPNVLSESFVYDDWGRTIRSTDVLGIVSTSVYDPGTGLMSTFTSKGNTVTYSYDAWGRVTQESGTDGTIRNTGYLWETDNNTPIVYLVRESGNNSPTSTVHYDAANRELLREDIRFNGQSRKISREYDSQGRLYRVSQPYFSSASKWEIYAYDGYDRIIRITSPSGEITSYSYSNNTVTETKKGVSSIKTFDGSGKLISVSDPAGTITYNLRPDGQPSSIVAPGNITTSFVYDDYGRQTQIDDPSAGVKTFTYDTAGNLETETDAAGRTITMIYDKYHRLETKLNAENVSTTYGYDGYGNVISEVSLNGTSRGFTYDDFNRLESMRETIVDNHWLETKYTYEAGRVKELKYTSHQNGLIGSEVYGYSNGYHVSTRWGTSGPYTWQLNSENVYGQPENAYTGGINRVYTYDAAGLLTGRRALTTAGGVTLMYQGYQFDPLKGNLQNRTDYTRSITESFLYDNLNRLTNYGSNSVSYDIKGNILTKSDAGQMAYNHSTKPYAVTDVITSVVPSRNQNITYNSQMRPATITENGYVAAFTYDVSGERVKTHITNNGSLFLTRYYIGGVYEFDQTASTTREKLYLGGNYYSAPVVMVKTGTGSWTFYNILRDHLGSIMQITTLDGAPVAEYSYDPWGRMRNPNNQQVYAVGSEPELFLGRGFTGHEHLSMFGLVNMNARLYDPVLGRFLSPDPYVQAPDFSQNFNRYSYALNNPLIYVDEDGEFLHIIIGAVIGGIINTAIHWNQIHNFWDGVAAFGIGAAGGALTAATGGAVLSAFGTTAGISAGAGGFIGGALAGGAGYISGTMITSLGNFGYFGDQLPNAKQLLKGLGISMLTGGAIQGTNASLHGRNFFTGKLPTSTPTPMPMPALTSNTPEPTLNTDGMRTQLKSMPGMERAPESTLSLPAPKMNEVNLVTPKSGTNVVYQGLDASEKVRYIGITGRDPGIRFGEQLNSIGTGKELLNYRVIDGATGLTRMQARVWEQTLINHYGLQNGGGQLLNKINSIAPKNWVQHGIKP